MATERLDSPMRWLSSTTLDEADVRQRFIGTWELVATGRKVNGVEKTNATWGSKPCGIIMYHPNGYMSAVLHSVDPEHRPLGTSIAADAETMAHDEHKWATIAQHASGYSGPYKLNVDEQQIVHGPLHAAIRPDFHKQLQVRDYNFETRMDGEYLELSANITPNCRDCMLWRRLM